MKMKTKAAGQKKSKRITPVRLAKKKKRSTPKEKPALLSVENRQQIISENREIGKKLAWKMLRSWRVTLPVDEVVSIVDTALCDAASKFNPKFKVSFKTFLFYHLRGLLIKEITRLVYESKTYGVVNIHAIENSDGDTPLPLPIVSKMVDSDTPERVLEKKELRDLFSKGFSELDELERDVLYRSFYGDEALSDIAKDLGYCRCHISRVKTKALDVLKSFLSTNLHIEEKAKQKVKARRSYSGGRGRRKTREALEQAA